MTDNEGVSGLLLILFFATPIGVAVYMFWLAWTRVDPRPDSISVQYEPPNNLTPGECGALVDNAVDLRRITATITDLSVQGYLTIEQKNAADATGDHTDYVFHLAKPLTEFGKLKPHEREVMTSLFMSTNPLLILSMAVKDLEKANVASANKVSASIGNKMLASVLSRVGAKAKEASDQYQALSGTRQEGSWRRRRFGICGVVGPAAMTKIESLGLIGIGVFAGAIILGFGFFLPARTRAGTQMLAKVLGFREFLVRVEKDQIERLEKTPELFEKYLPYAMALAVENKWTQTFGKITVPPPQWYQGKRRNGFLPMHLTNDLNQIWIQAGTAQMSSSHSSGPAGESPNPVAS